MLLLVALLTSIGTWAQSTDPVITGYTATSGTGGANDNEGFEKLVDGLTSTKWCVTGFNNSKTIYIEFNTDYSIIPTGYVMTTGNDTYSNTTRNPKNWAIKAKLNTNDDWTTIASVTDDDSMPTGTSTDPYADGEYTISNTTNTYKYFRFEVTAIQGSSIFQLSEFKFRGQVSTDVAKNIQYANISGVDETYICSGAEIKPVPVVTAADGTVLTEGTDYSVVWSGDGTTGGTYTITVTGMGNYSGTQVVTYTVTYDITMPVTGTKTFTIPSGVNSVKVYDDGGSGSKYSTNCDGTLVLTAPEGYVLQLSGDVKTNRPDELIVYDGSTTSGAILLEKLYNSYDPCDNITSTGRSMTLHFYSDDNNNNDWSGIDLTVTLVDASIDYSISVGTATGGDLTSNKGTAKVGQTVTLTATPASGYILSDLSVTDSKGDVPLNWDLWTNTATFTMRTSNVTVTHSFSDTWTSDGLSVNMPFRDKRTVTIPSGVKSFKVYDDGGSGSNYSEYCSDTLVLTAPTGCVLQLSGSVTADYYGNGAYLRVFDNSEASGTTLISRANSTSDGTKTNITTVTSTGQSMTLYFYSNDNLTYAGLDLTVDVIISNMELADNADNTTAITGADGYLAKNVTLTGRTLYKDGDWNTLCLPFALTDFTGTPLEGATVKTLTGSSYDETNKTLSFVFSEATSLTAGEPCIVKWTTTADNVTNPVFQNVTIDGSAPGTTTQGLITFTSLYAPYSATATDKTILFVGADNKLYYPLTGAYVGAFRAYFSLSGLSAGDPASNARAFQLVFDEDDITGVSGVEASSALPAQPYDLQGRKVANPQKGQIYIVNGKAILY